MKKKLLVVSLFAFMLFTVFSCGSKNDGSVSSDVVFNDATADGNSKADGPVMSFETLEYDFGDIMQGERVEYPFKFKNTGSKDLIISDNSTSCGCTVPDYPKGAIAPGKGGVVTVAFNSGSKEGRVSKTVTLMTNCENRDVVLTIKANILVP